MVIYAGGLLLLGSQRGATHHGIIQTIGHVQFSDEALEVYSQKTKSIENNGESSKRNHDPLPVKLELPVAISKDTGCGSNIVKVSNELFPEKLDVWQHVGRGRMSIFSAMISKVVDGRYVVTIIGVRLNNCPPTFCQFWSNTTLVATDVARNTRIQEHKGKT